MTVAKRKKKKVKIKKAKRRSWSLPDVREFKKLARGKTSAAKLASRFKRKKKHFVREAAGQA
jgi:hypothetical protein